MDRVKRNRLIRLSAYFLLFVLPIIGMANCAGNESFGIIGCHIDFPFARVYADVYYALLLFSAFTFLVPLILYIVIGVGLTECIIAKLLK